MKKLPYGKAISYSGYREGQSPHTRTYPSYEEIKEDYNTISDFYKDKQVIITETGWPTASSRGIDAKLANGKNQKRYLKEMKAWSEEEKITIFFFEAFNEPWKGSSDANEPEKHWGIYDVNRKEK